MDLISHPFRLSPTGEVATVADGSTQANAEAIVVLALTRQGERVLVPGFGVTDPVFGELDLAELAAGIATYGPEDVSVSSVSVDYPDDHTADVTIEFEE